MTRFTKLTSALLLIHGAAAKIIWDPVHNTCDGFAQSIGQPSLDAAVSKLWGDIDIMAKYTSDLMDKATSFQSSDPWEYLRVVGTYDTFFDIMHPDSDSRWNSVKNTLDAMKTASSTDFVYMMCDDADMYSTDSNGNLIWTVPHNKGTLDMTGKVKPCAEGNQGQNQIAYRAGWTVRSADLPAYIVICSKYNGGDIYLGDLSFESGKSLDEYTTLSTTLFHEFLHVLVPSMRGDQAGGTAVGGERYRVQGTEEVRSSYAPENPDSITLFALAMADESHFYLTTRAETKEEVM